MSCDIYFYKALPKPKTQEDFVLDYNNGDIRVLLLEEDEFKHTLIFKKKIPYDCLIETLEKFNLDYKEWNFRARGLHGLIFVKDNKWTDNPLKAPANFSLQTLLGATKSKIKKNIAFIAYDDVIKREFMTSLLKVEKIAYHGTCYTTNDGAKLYEHISKLKTHWRHYHTLDSFKELVGTLPFTTIKKKWLRKLKIAKKKGADIVSILY